MSLNPDIRDQAYQFFIEEAQELLQVLETGLLDLREDHSTPKVHELMRAAHSIKGGAASVELSVIELLAHRLEDFFKALYSDSVDFDAELESLLLQGYDCLSNPLTEQIESGSYDEEAALLTAEPVFAALEVRLEDALKNADSYIPSSNDLGVDIVSSIFEVDVVQGIEHLQEIADNPDNFDLNEEFQGTLDLFNGFAELFNFPGFSDIVQTAQTALNLNPDCVLAIVKATIADCTIAKDLVLAGDREQGGTVSPTLMALAQSIDSTDLAQTPPDDGNDLWSIAPSIDNDLTDDVFGEIPQTEETDLSLDNSDVDDVFGTIPDASTSEIDVDNADEEVTVSTPDLDDVFGTLPDVEEASDSLNSVDEIFASLPDASTSEINTESEIATSTPDLDDVFGTLPDVEEASDSLNSVDEIFASLPDASTSEINTESEIATSTPDLDDVFGTLPDVEEASDSFDSVDEIFASLPDASTSEIDVDNADKEVTASTPDLDDVFGTLPDVEEASDSFDTVDKRKIVEETSDRVERIFDSIINETSAKQGIKDSDPSTKIADAVKSIENVFDRLPAVETDPASLALPAEKSAIAQSKPSPPKPNKSQSKSQPTKAAPKLSVRVDLERLERMNNLIGELTINRNSLSLQNEQLQEGVTELGQKFLRFREVAQKLREISDRMLVEQRFESPQNLKSSSEVDNSAEFDALEMDNYSDVYASIQNLFEEIVQLEESVDDITIFAKQSDRSISGQRQMLGQMRDELMWVRMLPLNKILQRFPRTIRDLSSKYNKPVDLILNGTDVLVDKAVLEKLSDPLLHLLRNGFDHGIESSDVRANCGKLPAGRIEINAYHQGNQTVIEIKDDGKGLDVAKIAQKGIEKGLIDPSEVATATKERIYDLIFEPGFSTASKVSELSGRGVGMNIVRSQIETLKGKITVTSSPGRGSTFTLRLPLTLTIAKLLVCSLGATAFAIPSDSIEEIIIPTEEQIKIANRQKFLSLNGKLVPIYPLKEILEYNCPVGDADLSSKAFKTIASPEDWFAPLLLLRRGQQLFALEVVNLVSEQELVIKPYGKAIASPQYSYGCTILGDGSLIPAFDGAALIGTILGEEVRTVGSRIDFASDMEETADSIADTQAVSAISEDNLSIVGDTASSSNKITTVKTIMIVDDSTALRRTMGLTLEKQGYRVIQKKDGRDALDGFRQNPEIDLIICDVEMPTMNGFEFLGMRRRDSKLSKIPTFMLTSRSGAKHRNLAKQLGADGYFTKPYIEQEFVSEIKKVLGNNNLAKKNSPKPSKLKQKKILIIDDSSALRRTLSLCLQNKGYEVLQGRDGNEGLELLRKNLQTDLVICDIEMPNMNGFEFLTSRRQDSKLSKIPTIMLTSRSTEKHRSLANSLGADGYFTKPYIQEKFLQDVDSFIKKYSKSR